MAEVQKVSRLPDLAGHRIDEMFMRAEGAGARVCMRACLRVSAVLISFIYSWTGRSADASGEGEEARKWEEEGVR